ESPFRIRGIHRITGNGSEAFVRYLLIARRKKELGSVLVILDGDAKKVEGQQFCAATTAAMLAERGRAAGAGLLFSLAVVFLRQEFESILIPVAPQLEGIKSGVLIPP